MSADDPLLRLSIEALTQLTNAGLVKRAQRELETLPAPQLERVDGSLNAVFADGVRTQFPPGAGVREARCSCGAALCRHRLIAVLAWQRQAGEIRAEPLRSPGAIRDEGLQQWAGPLAWAQAERIRAGGLLVDVRRPGAGDPVPTALLPHASVRFHGGDDPAAAQSDAAESEHRAQVVLAVWAFQRADAEAPESASVQVQLGARQVRSDGLAAPLAALCAGLLRHGLGDGGARHAPALAAAQQAAEQAGATWMQLALQALEQWLAAYAARSALFELHAGLPLLAEIAARERAARGAGALAPQHALGVGERMLTPLARVRLRALGLRIRADGEQRSASVALVDPDTSARIAWRCDWDNAGSTGAASAQRAAQVRVSNSGRLLELAHGQLVSVSVQRRADGELRLGSGHGGRTSLLGQSPDWSDLPAAIVHTRIGDRRGARAHLPPPLLRPRQALTDHVVFSGLRVADIGFDPATQCLHALLHDADDAPLLLLRPWERAAPGALDALARALNADGTLTIAGSLNDTGSLPQLDPWALTDGQTLTVPDLAAPDGAVRQLPIATLPHVDDPLAGVLRRAEDWLATRLINPGHHDQAMAVSNTLRRAGLSDLADGVHWLATEFEASDDTSAYHRLGDLLIQLALTRHALAGASD